MTSADAGESTVGGAAHRAKRSAWLTRLALLVVAGVVTVIVVRLIGRIDWAAVYDALRHLTWWQPFVLLAVVVGIVRGAVNASGLDPETDPVLFGAGLLLAGYVVVTLVAALAATFRRAGAPWRTVRAVTSITKPSPKVISERFRPNLRRVMACIRLVNSSSEKGLGR